MTGEITLTGQVLPIGGLKEKALAAQGAGIKRVIAPKRNEPDLEEFPEALRKDLEFVWVDARRAAKCFEACAADRVCSPDERLRARGDHGSEEEGGQGWRGRRGSQEQPVRPARRSRTRSCARTSAQAYESARDAAARLGNGKSPTKQIFDDKKLQKDLRNAAESFRDASRRAARGAASRSKRRLASAGCCSLAVVGAGIALAVSEGLRKKVLDALFGAEEEFEYTSTTTRRPRRPQPAGHRRHLSS